MLKAFPSSQSNITADSPRVYLFAVEDMPLEAVKRACRALVRGEVDGRNHSFAPSAPELAQIAKGFEQTILVETWKADRLFVAAGSELWKQLCQHKGKVDFPTFKRDGVDGWWFDREVAVEASKLTLPAPVSPEQEAANRARLAKTLGVKFSIGDPDAEDGDMGQREAS